MFEANTSKQSFLAKKGFENSRNKYQNKDPHFDSRINHNSAKSVPSIFLRLRYRKNKINAVTSRIKKCERRKSLQNQTK